MDFRERLKVFLAEKNISVKAFEEECGLSNGAVSKMGDNTRRSTIDKISTVFPELNTNWLLTGEGTMLKPITQSVGDIGGNASGVNVHGNGITINPNAYDALMEIVKATQQTTEKFQDITQKSQQQIDRLIALLEKVHGA